MSVTLTIAGVPLSFPTTGETDWGADVTSWATAVSAQLLSKAGGAYTLSGEVDFGPNFGLQAISYKSRAASLPTSGVVRLGNTEAVAWRDNVDASDLLLSVDPATNELLFDGNTFGFSTARTVADTSTIDLTLNVNEITADIVGGSITNSLINSSAAIAYSKLALSDSILNADVNSAAAIAYSKLALSDSIVNADINSSAAIAYSKLSALTTGRVLVSNGSGFVSTSGLTSSALAPLAALNTNRALVSNGSGFVTDSATTSTQIGYLSTLSSNAQDQIDSKLSLSGGTMTGKITLDADPTSNLHAATKQYVDASAGGGTYALIRDDKTSGVDGGTFNSGAWRTRDLNTEIDPGGIVSLSSNQFTLGAGTYRIYARAPAYKVNQHRIQIYNVTDASALIVGPNARNGQGDVTQTDAVVSYVFSIAGTKAFEIQHQCSFSRSSDGFGTANTFATEVYTTVEIWKLA